MSKKMLMALAITGIMGGCSTTCNKKAAKNLESKNGCGANGCGGSAKDAVKKCAKDVKDCAAKAKKKGSGSNGCGANGCS